MENQKKDFIFKMFMLILLTIMITFMGTTVLMYNYFNKGEGVKYLLKNDKNSDLESTLSGFRKVLDKKYLGEINDDDLRTGAIRGYIEALDDPYTTYLSKEELEELEITTLGDYVGIGIYMVQNINDDTIVIASPIKGSPAQEAGIQPGDVIISVDDVEYTGEQMSIAAAKIKGIEGTKVKLKLLRKEENVELELTRRKIETIQTESKLLEDNIGYIYIQGFDTGCANEFKKYYDELKNQGITSLIIDMRNNGGGLVDESLKIADYIVGKDKATLITKDKNGKTQISKSKSEPIVDMPIIVLTNENTASASEILVGALKDNGKCKIVGGKTFGKGVIQEVINVEGGGALKVTTQEYFTPNETKINKVGIMPDIEIVEDEKNESDIVLQKAIEEIKK